MFLEEPGLVCEYHRLDAVAETQLLEDVRDVCLHGRLADVDVLSDLCIGQAVGDQPEDLLLAGGELVELFRRRGPRKGGELLITRFVIVGERSASPAATVRARIVIAARR